jgi:hypothetical protein
MNEMTPQDRKHLKSVYDHMKERCNNPHNNRYCVYGGRGIKVCNEWNSVKPFYEWSIQNGYKKGLTIDRKDCNKGYSPDNCRWVTLKFQQSNKRNNHNIFYNGITLTLSQWSTWFGINRKTLSDRIKHGWSIAKALSTPCKAQYRNGLYKAKRNEVA